MKAAEETARPEQCFFVYGLGISTPAQQPTREVESGVDVRQHQLLKALPIFELQLTHNSLLNTKASLVGTPSSPILFSLVAGQGRAVPLPACPPDWNKSAGESVLNRRSA